MTFFLLIDILPNKAIPNFIFDELPAESFHVDVKNNLQDKLFSNGRRTKEEETNEKGSTEKQALRQDNQYIFLGLQGKYRPGKLFIGQGRPKSAIAAYDYTYNPEKGLALLKEAGYDTSKGEVYLGSILTLPESHYLFKPAPIIQAQLAKHNIKVNIEPYESGTMFEKLFGGDYVMAICGGSYGSDASGYATVHGSSAMGQLGGCCSYLVDEEMDALFEQGVAEMDPANRGEIYGEIMRILFENCPQTGIGHKQVIWN